MNTSYRSVPLALPLGLHATHTLPLDVQACTVPGPLRLRVRHGGVWITWEGGTDDHFLRAGETVDVPPGRRAWVSAEPRLAPGAALLAIEAVPPPAPPHAGWPLRRALGA